MKFIEHLKTDLVYLKGFSRLDKSMKSLVANKQSNIATHLEASVDRYSNRPALIDEKRSLTYTQMEHKANKFAAWAINSQLKPGDCVALLMENHVDYIPFWFGMAKVGLTTALINNNLTGKGLAHCINISEAKVLVTSSKAINAVTDASPHLNDNIQAWHLGKTDQTDKDLYAAIENCSTSRPPASYRQDIYSKDTALFIFTSGTTGLPKAARMTHIRCLQMMHAFIYPCSMTPEDRVFLTLPLYHGTGGVCGAGSALISGAAVVIREKFSASRFWSDAKDTEVTAFVYVGELNRYLMNNPPSKAEKQHKIVKAFGNGMRPDVWTNFVKRTGIERIYEFYGSSEGNVSLFNMDAKIGAIGRIPPFLKSRIPCRLIKLDTETGEPLRDKNGLCIEASTDEPGEAMGKIDNKIYRFEGYHDKKQTEKKVIHNVTKKGDAYFRTGDLLRCDKRGYFYFVDRLGDTFRWKSENVSTTEVSGAVNTAPGVETANVYGVEVAGHDGRAGMAAITGDNIDLNAVYQHLAEALPSYARPIFLRVQQKEEMTGTLKFRKVELQKQGFDPQQCPDPLYVISATDSTYIPLDTEVHSLIIKGDYRI